jgi:phospholipid/cholesterol/gamma-HCH transport system substrate-binding protein
MVGRVVGLAAVIVAVAAVAIVLLDSGGGSYMVKARFQNASQLVKGNLVQVSGKSIGSVKKIDLTRNGQAEVEMEITDGAYAPLRRGTQATVRQASLSGVANRYIDLHLPGENQAGSDIPEGGVLESDKTTTAVDLDQLFNVFDPDTRDSLRKLIRGFGASYAGQSSAANRGWMYLNPTLAASSRLFEELNYDAPTLKRFVQASSKLVTDLASRREDLAGLVTNLNQTTGAIAEHKDGLEEAIGRLPTFMRRANTTFVNLRATLDDLKPLVDDSKPVAKKLKPFLDELRPLARDARPTLRDLASLTKKAGGSNDLIELTQSAIPLRDVAVGPIQRNGKARDGALPASTKALAPSDDMLATARPYAPDLTGWFDDFSTSGMYDALGGGSRAALNLNLATSVDGVLNIVPYEQRGALRELFKIVASTDQRKRCPGAIERGAVWKPTTDFPCDETQVPLGP